MHAMVGSKRWSSLVSFVVSVFRKGKPCTAANDEALKKGLIELQCQAQLYRRAFCFATCVCLHVVSSVLLRNACPSVRLKAELVSKIDTKIDTKIDPKSVLGAALGLPKST